MIRKIVGTLAVLVMMAAPAMAQLGLNYTTFSPGQTITASQFTDNFTNISNKALDRTGGTATGAITFDSGAEFNGSFTIGSSNLQPFDSTGKIKEISTTYFASVSGVNLTDIPETAITDGAVLARIAENTSITGLWAFTNASGLSVTNQLTAASIKLTTGEITRPDGAGAAAALGNGTTDFYGTTHEFRDGVGSTLFGVFDSNGLAVSGTVTVNSVDTTVLKENGVSILVLDDTTQGVGFYNSNGRWNGDFIPFFSASQDLGSSANRWAEVWVQAGVLNSSDARLKREITATKLGIEFIDQLKPVEYFWRTGNTTTRQYGFIAQDLLKLGFEGVNTSNPKSYALNYDSLLAPMVKGMQEMHEEIHVLELQNKLLLARIVELEKGYGERRAVE